MESNENKRFKELHFLPAVPALCISHHFSVCKLSVWFAQGQANQALPFTPIMCSGILVTGYPTANAFCFPTHFIFFSDFLSDKQITKALGSLHVDSFSHWCQLFLCRNATYVGSRYKISPSAESSLFPRFRSLFTINQPTKHWMLLCPGFSPAASPAFPASLSQGTAKETCPHLHTLVLRLCFGYWRLFGVEATIVWVPRFHKGVLMISYNCSKFSKWRVAATPNP